MVHKCIEFLVVHRSCDWCIEVLVDASKLQPTAPGGGGGGGGGGLGGGGGGGEPGGVGGEGAFVRETPVRAAGRRAPGRRGAGGGGGAAECKAPPAPYEWLNT